jgi:hypothetical protein
MLTPVRCHERPDCGYHGADRHHDGPRARASAPVQTLAAFTLIAVLAGIGAAILPARRAARLNVLEALDYE